VKRFFWPTTLSEDPTWAVRLVRVLHWAAAIALAGMSLIVVFYVLDCFRTNSTINGTVVFYNLFFLSLAYVAARSLRYVVASE
jgi:uncharacterized membrane protein YqjE